MERNEDLGADWGVLGTFLLVNTVVAWALGLLATLLTGLGAVLYNETFDNIVDLAAVEGRIAMGVSAVLALLLFGYNLTQIRAAKDCGIPFIVRVLLHIYNLAIFPSVFFLGSFSPLVTGAILGVTMLLASL